MTVIILKSVSGAGKSTFAEFLAHHTAAEICCADDYFTNYKGEYNFDASKLGEAHRKCKEKFQLAIRSERETIIVANTNTTDKDCRHYEEWAETYNYTVFSVIIENRHGNSDVHGVPDEVKDRQEKNLRNSMRLK